MIVKSEYWTMRLFLEELTWVDLLSKFRQAKSGERLELLKNIDLTVEEIEKIRQRANLNDSSGG